MVNFLKGRSANTQWLRVVMVWIPLSYGPLRSLLLARPHPKARLTPRRGDGLQLAPDRAMLEACRQRFTTRPARVRADRVPMLPYRVDEDDPRVVYDVRLDSRHVQVRRYVVSPDDVPIDVPSDLKASQMRYPRHARRAQRRRLGSVQTKEHASVVLVGVRLAGTPKGSPAQTGRPLVSGHGAGFVDASTSRQFFLVR